MKKVTLYTSPTCVFCPALKQLLDKRQVEYEEIDIYQDDEAVEDMKRISGQMSVPVTLIDDEVIVGFNKKKLIEALES